MLAFRLTLLCWLLPLASSWVAASEHDSSAQTFRFGVEQFQSGDLEGARESFETARAGGLSSVSLVYNLGVVYYRLGDYESAERTFHELLNTEHQALASYNLGLVALAQGKEPAARHWFARVATPSTPEKLRALAEVQLEKLAPHATEDYSRGSRMGYLAASVGYDSNIAGLPDTSATSEGGIFGEVLAAASTTVGELGEGRLRLGGVAYGRHYPANDEYDTSLLQGELIWSRTLASSVQGASLTMSQSWYDADALERRYGVEGFQRWSACGGFMVLERCSVALAAAHVDGGDGFEGYDGEWYRLRLSAMRRFRGWLLDGDYRWEVNDRKDFRAGDQFISVSPQHHTLELTGRYRLRPDLTLGWIGAYRYSRYQDAHVLLEGNALVSEIRVDSRIEAGVFAERRLTGNWLVRAEWQVQDNDSRIDRYDYRRHTLIASLEGSF
ncbi:tetratricopeptide repeat protein [Marinobacter sp. M216]|uniref:Tetratricopeptide repeat protein n=1 Tax=Marinobacter albus TaxID=3030833 RepID=A0ABT7HEW0_9GAMM|nr:MULTISPECIES: tetratricopeptide repeat protein [unclassified Marinobacter]MBW7472358.1 tetratricopeptide repeat protein [Marinobacter sp. F4218]MDK9558908.1 tetratricopeptide repeat protein [Marinobacter sp. M216]